jgi:hypothetical protein
LFSAIARNCYRPPIERVCSCFESIDGARVEVRFGEGGGCPCGGLWWSTDFVTESRTGTDDGARVGVCFGEGDAVRAAGCGGQRTLSRNHGRERMMVRGWKSASGRGRLSVRRGVVVNGGNEFPSRHMEVLRTGTDDGARLEVHFGDGGGCPCGGVCLWGRYNTSALLYNCH